MRTFRSLCPTTTRRIAFSYIWFLTNVHLVLLYFTIFLNDDGTPAQKNIFGSTWTSNQDLWWILLSTYYSCFMRLQKIMHTFRDYHDKVESSIEKSNKKAPPEKRIDDQDTRLVEVVLTYVANYLYQKCFRANGQFFSNCVPVLYYLLIRIIIISFDASPPSSVTQFITHKARKCSVVN